MRSSVIKKGTWLASFMLAVCLCAHAEVKLPAIFSDGMVMQQQTKANLWGTATPNKKITVTTGQERRMETFCFHSRSRRSLFHYFQRWKQKNIK